MIKSIEPVDLPAGEYLGFYSGYTAKAPFFPAEISTKSSPKVRWVEFKVNQGVRGINIPVSISVDSDGYAIVEVLKK